MNDVRTRSVLTSLLLAATAVACSDASGTAAEATPTAQGPEAPETIQVALLGSFTGGATSVAADVRRGAETAVTQINARGGILGKRLTLAVVDDQGSPEKAAAELSKLARSGVVFGIGPTSNETARAVLPLVKADKVLLLSPSATGMDLDCVETEQGAAANAQACAANRAGFDANGTVAPVLFRTSPSDAYLATAVAQFASQPVKGNRRCQSIAIVRQADEAATALADRLAERYRMLNLAVRRTVDVEADLANPLAVEASVEALAASPAPDCQIVLARPSVAGSYMRAFKEWTGKHPNALPSTFTTIGGEGFLDPALLAGGAEVAAEDTLAVAPDATPSSPANDAFRSLFLAQNPGVAPGRFTATAYDAVVVLAGAMSRARTTSDVAVVRRALLAVSTGRAKAASGGEFLRLTAMGEDVDYQGASGPLDFDGRTGSVRNDYGVWRIKQGSFVREATFDASVLTGE
jgi:ABC-type branched-subunit amino acid transport system substrate-binding protein